MKIFPTGVLLFAAVLASGCATSIDIYKERPIENDEAVILVGVDSEIALNGIKSCAFCVVYQLQGRKDIAAYPFKVGSTFQVLDVGDAYERTATLNGKELKVQERGIYYYGTIYSTSKAAGIKNDPNPRLLLAAKRKYGNRFDGLKAINFTWPDPSADPDTNVDYHDSPKAQALLRTYAGKHVHIAKISPPKESLGICRRWGPLALPDFLPYEEYIRRALNHELRSANIYGDAADSLELTGTITKLSYSFLELDAAWHIGLQLEDKNGHAAQAHVDRHFEIDTDRVAGCNQTEDEFPVSTQALVEAIVASPEFQSLLSQ